MRHALDRLRACGCTLALSEAADAGAPVAHTELFVNRGSEYATQANTLVHGDHRGHRLGRALKVTNLLSLLHHRPDVRRVITVNAECNRHMTAVDEQLGFVAATVMPRFVRSL